MESDANMGFFGKLIDRIVDAVASVVPPLIEKAITKPIEKVVAHIRPKPETPLEQAIQTAAEALQPIAEKVIVKPDIEEIDTLYNYTNSVSNGSETFGFDCRDISMPEDYRPESLRRMNIWFLEEIQSSRWSESFDISYRGYRESTEFDDVDGPKTFKWIFYDFEGDEMYWLYYRRGEVFSVKIWKGFDYWGAAGLLKDLGDWE